jgi:pheromone shutdown protein TraB
MLTRPALSIRHARAVHLMETTPFWLCAIGFPIAVLIVSTILRVIKAATPFTCATDIFGTIIVLDAITISDSVQFSHFTSSASSASLVAWMTLLAILVTVVWVICLIDVEPRLLEYHNLPSGNRVFPFKSWGAIWALCIAFIATHVGIFTGRIPI